MKFNRWKQNLDAILSTIAIPVRVSYLNDSETIFVQLRNIGHINVISEWLQ